MSVIRLRALEVLGATLERLCPDLSGRVCAGPPERGHRQKRPCLTITPANYRFVPYQERCHYAGGFSTGVFQVGVYEAIVQLRIGARTARQRYALEHAVSQIFVSQQYRPGILIVKIPDCWDAIVSYELDETQWESDGFDQEWDSIISLQMEMPALVERGGVYTIDEIRSCLTEDMTTAFDSIPASAIECVSIDENGNITAITP